MKTTFKTFATRSLVHALAASLALQPAFAQEVSIKQTPLATSGGASILANLMFILDDSGSMRRDYLPDYILERRQCLQSASTDGFQPDLAADTSDPSNTTCARGDPPYETGGQNGVNGNAYDPHVTYKPALHANGTVVAVITAASVTSSPKTVPTDAFGIQDQATPNVDITAASVDFTFCNSNNICKRSGALGDASALVSGVDSQGVTMSAGRFPYRTHDSNSSKQIFGLPEMMTMATFSRTSTTVTGTTLRAHGLAPGDILYVDGVNHSDIDGNSRVLVTASSTTFTFTSGSGTISARNGAYRKHVVLSSTTAFNRVSPDTFVTVTSAGHGLVTGDVIRVFPSDTDLNPGSSANIVITRVDDDSFTYTYTGGSGNQSGSGSWVRHGLYNDRDSASGAPAAYTITPIEYCSDANLTNCVEVLPGNTPPSGFAVPAYARYCQTQQQAFVPGAIGDPSGTPRCRGKFVDSGTTKWRWGRYGLFNRTTIAPTSPPSNFIRSSARSDCAAAPSCTYEEEIVNYAHWFAYYRTRMQMMKTAAGRAFQSFISNPTAVPHKLRVGFITINPYRKNDGSLDDPKLSDPVAKYLKISEFNTTHADAWYQKFYAQKPGPYTPLREALSRVGWIYAGKLDEAPLTENIPVADDPMQAACQRNFALLTTDGYWNRENGLDLAGNGIGNADNVNPTIDAPYTSPSVDRATTGTFDGGFNTVVTTTTPTVVREQNVCKGNLQTTFGSGDQRACGCTDPKQQRTVERRQTQTQLISQTDGVETKNTTNTTYTFHDATTCADGNWQEVEQLRQVRQVRHCRDRTTGTPNNTVTFWDGATNTCTLCSSDDRVLIEQRRVGKKLLTKIDGVVTNTGTLQQATGGTSPYTGTAGYRFANANSPTEGSGSWKAGITPAPPTGSGCNDNSLTGDMTSPADTATATETVVASGSAAPPAYITVPTPPGPTYVGYAAGFTFAELVAPTPGVVGTPATTITPGGYGNTLADVAMYYYRTDLRGGFDHKLSDPNDPQTGNPTGPSTSPNTDPADGDVSANVVPAKAGAKNFAVHQHMVTFSLGMVDGLMRYQPDYEIATTGDYLAIKNATANGCFWVSGVCNWPQPFEEEPSALDDLWHAAVNGRGQYFLSKDVDGLQAGITGTLNAVNAQVAAAAASATSSPNITQTNNQIFSTTYETITWSGKVFAQTIDPNTGNVNAAIQWHADTQLLGTGDCSGTHGKACASADSRSLFTFDGAGTGLLKPFLWGSLGSAQAFFDRRCDVTTPLSQCADLGAAGNPPFDAVNSGEQLVNYLRGQTGNEGGTPPRFRDRTFIDPATNAITQTVLGDTISAKPAYVREATFNYDGPADGYAAYKADKASRRPRVYVGANDGFLHAFNGDTGQESWGYAPGFLLPGLWELADTGYSSSSRHRYYVDGSPETGDACASQDQPCPEADWRTILVGGVNGGGRGYYALDISSMDDSTPGDDPKGLWEFCSDSALCAISDEDLGYTYGNAVMGKRSSDGRWVVVVTSGLNNVNPGSGGGFFFVLDATTGEVLNKVPTGVGDDTTPSGLMKISAFFENALTDATFRYVYGGDQLGNVFRLDMGEAVTSPDPVPDPVVIRLATLKDGDGRLQPITTRPALTHIGTKNILYVGTGRYLGDPDLADGGPGAPAWQHTLYAFSDKGAPYTAASLRDSGGMQQRFLTAISPTERGMEDVGAGAEVDWAAAEAGWFVDFNPSLPVGIPPTLQPASPGEGVNIVDPRLVLGTLVVTTNAPAAGGSCAVGGTSFFYNFNFRTGEAVSSSPNGVVGISLGGTITVGVAVVQLPSGAIKAISTGADTTKTTSGVSIGASGNAVKRFSYRLR